MLRSRKISTTVHNRFIFAHILYKSYTTNTGKNNGFPFLDILGYLKNTHKNPKFGKVREIPTREFPTKFPNWDLSHFAKFGYSLNTLKYRKMEIRYFFLCNTRMVATSEPCLARCVERVRAKKGRPPSLMLSLINMHSITDLSHGSGTIQRQCLVFRYISIQKKNRYFERHSFIV